MPRFELNQRVKLADHYIGKDDPVYIVAEMSANHNNDFNRAIEIIHAAKEAGADAIKLQTYTADTMTIDSDKSYFQIDGGTLWDGMTLYKLYQQAYTPWEWQPKLMEEANKLADTIIKNTYRTLMTRGMKGCYVYCIDKKLQEYLKNR